MSSDARAGDERCSGEWEAGTWAPIASASAEASATDGEQAAGEHLRALAEHTLGMKLVAAPVPRGPLPDAKQTWILRDAAGKARAVGQLSSAIAPDMVLRGVARANTIRRALDPATSAPILSTLATGALEGASFALWPACQSVPNRVTDVVARRLIERPVLRWLRELARETARPVPPELIAPQIDRPLCAMATNAALSPRARLSARAALKRLDGGQWRPMYVAMHGDLHAGNLLIDHLDATGRRVLAWAERFVAIDWCGASATGRPLFDLIRIAESLRTPHALLAQEIEAHCALLGGTMADARAHIAASLADLGAHLECFPVEAYAALADRVLGRLDLALNDGELA